MFMPCQFYYFPLFLSFMIMKILIFNIKMEFNLARARGIRWRLWQAFFQFIGSGAFFIASLTIFPIFYQYIDSTYISALLFTIGSSALFISNFMLWRNNGGLSCKPVALTQTITLFAIMCYLVGSIKIFPGKRKFDGIEQAQSYFNIGSFFLCISQLWKLYRMITNTQEGIMQEVKQNSSQFLVLTCSVAGTFCLYMGMPLYK